jgi:hypothetical protein
MRTNLEITYSALNSHYLMSNERINTEYLCDAIVMWAINTERIYKDIANSRRSITSVVWEAFFDLAEDHVKMEQYPRGYSCTSYQLKKWLTTYGDGYDALEKAVQELQKERETLQNDL